ncbi:MAG TPA: FAD-dependent oxidoreductase [Spirochaetia bacterium]|nr:FAD-dependent oxidoreductase [Spirochaetales bacterium]HRS64621.1 FAD-dependent oxidoreductase [Spirochaetia bacterium]HRV28007.1 FAD-dependent oxidoreductase [Spirochaetia bacterium]
MEKKIEHYDVVVIGGGPGGMTAALYAGRARLKTLLIEKSLIGGMATYTSEIENYPGFPEPIDGIELMKLFDKQFRRFGVDVKLTDVQSVSVECNTKIVSTFRTDYHAKAVIIATGNKPRLTGAKNEERFLNDKGISFCATCDAARNTGKRIMVIGSGDAAIEEGMFLTKFAREVLVSVIHNEGIMDANKVAQEKALANPKMKFIWNTVVESFEGDDMLKQVVLKNIKTGELMPYDVDTCFLFIGYVPNTKIFEGLVEMTNRGYIKTNENMETSREGFYAVGDCRDKTLRQVATAVGDGAIAGFMVEKYVEELEYLQKEIFEANGLIMAFIYNAVEAVDREYLARIEQIQKLYSEKVQLRRIDIYKSDRIACKLSYTKTPSLIFMKNGNILENITDLSNLDAKVAEAVKQYS